MNPHTPRPLNRRTSYHSRRELQAGQRRVQCLKLRIEGCSVREIGRRLGIGSSTVQGHIQQAIADQRASAAALAAQLPTAKVNTADTHSEVWERAAVDPVLGAARLGLLPASSYDEAYDEVEGRRPNAYKPDPLVEAYLRQHWSEMIAA